VSDRNRRPVRKGWLILLVLAVASARAESGVMTDPTAPLLRTHDQQSASGFSVAELGQELLGLFSSYSLSSILIRGEERIAVINDERVRVGDEIGRVRVAAIETGSVVLEGDGSVRVLSLHEKSIKTPVKVSK